MRIPAFFDASYAPSDVPLLSRLATTASKLVRLGLVELKAPEPLPLSLLHGLHDERYLDAFLNGEEPMASRQGIPWSPAIRDATLAMLGGQISAAAQAAESGIAMNIARGFHHAVYASGSGFCPLNGLALLALIQPDRKIMIIDCDEHGGNGTEEYAARLPNLYNVSIFGTRFGCLGGTRSWAFMVRAREQGFESYLDALRETGEIIDTHKPDLLVYQAGADCHENDPKSLARLSTSEMFSRDVTVFQMAKERDIPIMFVVAGGYQNEALVARLNANTVRAARWVWRGHSAAADT